MRLKYIDCLRGLAMIMVVYSHILSFGMKPYTPSGIGYFIQNTMLPLFFFVSGFVSYKKQSKDIVVKVFFKQIWKRVEYMLIPTFLMMGLMMFYGDKNWLEYLFRYDKGGYWFTIVLFQIIVIYSVFTLFIRYFKNPIYKGVILLLPILIMYVAYRFLNTASPWFVLLEIVKVKHYYLFFVIGALIRMFDIEGVFHYISKMSPKLLLSNNSVRTVLLFVICTNIFVHIAIGGGKNLLAVVI